MGARYVQIVKSEWTMKAQKIEILKQWVVITFSIIIVKNVINHMN